MPPTANELDSILLLGCLPCFSCQKDFLKTIWARTFKLSKFIWPEE